MIARLGVLAVRACCASPSLAYYRATPRRFCPATKQVNVEWFTDAKSVTLSSKEMTGLGKKSGHGSVLVMPKAGVIRLDYGNESDAPIKKIEPMVVDSPLVGDRAAVCQNGVSIAEVTFEGEEYAPEVIVKSVKNRLDDRAVVVVHLGRELTLPPGAEVPMPELEPGDPTVRTARAWTIRVPLQGDACGSKRVRNPGVILNMECAP